MTDHPITPPQDKVYLWWEEACKRPPSSFYEKLDYVAAKAAQQGADQELEACCEWVSQCRPEVHGWRQEVGLRAARRPKPKPDFKGLVERALAQTNAILNDPNCILPAEVLGTLELNRRELERLQELEEQGDD